MRGERSLVTDTATWTATKGATKGFKALERSFVGNTFKGSASISRTSLSFVDRACAVERDRERREKRREVKRELEESREKREEREEN